MPCGRSSPEEHKPVALFEEWDMQCIQLELKGSTESAEKYWYLGNNSFLLHGFSIIGICCLAGTAEERWFLGVPECIRDRSA